MKYIRQVAGKGIENIKFVDNNNRTIKKPKRNKHNTSID